MFARPYLAIFACALIVRLVVLWGVWHSLFGGQLLGDGQSYDQWARELIDDGWLWRHGLVYYQAPLYPYILAVIYTVAGKSIGAVLTVQCVLGSLACTAIAITGTIVFNRRAGLIAGGIACLYAPAIYFDCLVQKASPAFAVTSALLLCMALYRRRPGWGTAVLAGVSFSALCLLRENALFFAPVLGLWLWFGCNARPRVRLIYIGCCAVGAALLFGPVLLRNGLVGGEYHITTSQLGPNLYIGNNPKATGMYQALVSGHGNWRFERTDAKALAEKELGRELSAGEVSAFWRDKAISFALAQPGAWIRLTLKKAALVLNRREVPDADSIYAYADHSTVLRVLVWLQPFALLLVLAVLGAALLDRPTLLSCWPYLVFAIGFAGTVVLFMIMARYRHPIAPALALFAGYGVHTLLARRADLSRRRLGALIASGLVALILTFLPVSKPVSQCRSNAHYDLGVVLETSGQTANAVAAYRRAIAANPKHAFAQNNLGKVLALQGSTSAAELAFRKAIDAQPEFVQAHINLAKLLERTRRADEAADRLSRFLQKNDSVLIARELIDLRNRMKQHAAALALANAQLEIHPRNAELLNARGATYFNLGRYIEAQSDFHAATTAAPRQPRYWNNLGSVLTVLRRFDEAAAAYDTSLKLNPNATGTLCNLAAMHLQAGNTKAAADAYRRVTKLRPAHVPTLMVAAKGFESAGDWRSAVAAYEAILKVAPGNKEAAARLRTVRLMVHP